MMIAIMIFSIQHLVAHQFLVVAHLVGDLEDLAVAVFRVAEQVGVFNSFLYSVSLAAAGGRNRRKYLTITL